MFKIYSEKNSFENIVLYKEDTPNWNKIFLQHADIHLNMTQPDIDAECVEGTVIFEFIKANGGRIPKASDAYFANLYANNARMVDMPRAAFFVRGTPADALAAQNAYGVIVQSVDAIDDSVLNLSFFREVTKDEVIDDGALIGWMRLLKLDFPPSNSVVVSDPYLFSNSEVVGGVHISIGERNTIRLLDGLLPATLSTDYHVTIVAERVNKSDNWHNTLVANLQANIQALRNTYAIVTEVIFLKSEHLHKRRLVLNYVNGSCDKGFGVFKVADDRTVRSNNDVRLSHIFSGIIGRIGDTEYDSATKGLLQVKNEYQRGGGPALINRLINDV